MSSIIKVDQIQLADGSTPTLADLSISTTGTGKVLQVVQERTSAYVNTSSESFTDTGLSASITPTSTSSDILIAVTFFSGKHTTDTSIYLQIANSSGTRIFSVVNGFAKTYGTNSNINVGGASSYIHSPATTNQLTYKLQIKRANSTTGSVYLNWYDNASDETFSTITLMEIAG